MQRVHYRIDNAVPVAGGPLPRVPCAPEDADLVSSLLPDGRHAPVLDIDMPATLYACPNGTSVLRVRGSGNSKEIFAFLEGGIAAGFLHVRSRDMFFARPEHLEETMEFPDLLLAVPAELRGSHTAGHHHLLLDVGLEWAAYEEMLRSAQRSGFVSTEFVLLCSRMQKGFLWLPGKKRAWLQSLFGGLDPYEMGGCPSGPVASPRKPSNAISSAHADLYFGCWP